MRKPQRSASDTTPTNSTTFGSYLAVLGDVDDDDLADVAIGSLDGDYAVYVYGGRTGEPIHQLEAPDGLELLSLSGVGDFDGDGIHDYCVSFARPYTYDQRGAVSVRSGRDGTVLCGFSEFSNPKMLQPLGDVSADGA